MSSARMATVYEKLYKAVCNQSTNNVMAVTHEIYGMPVLFVDEYFHVVSMHPAGAIGNPEWDEISRSKALNQNQIFHTLDEFLSGKKAFYEPFYAASGSCADSPKLFAEVVQDETVHGHIIVFWQGEEPPTDEDFEIIGLVRDAISLRIASRIKSMGSWNLALSTKLEDLLAPNTPAHLEKLACEAISGTLQPEYTICVATIGALASQKAFAEYAVHELQQLYRNVICLIYDNTIVTLYGGAAPHGSGTPNRSVMAEKLFAFFGSHDMICGLSDSFTDPRQTRAHYRQALLTARLVLKLGRDKSTTFSDLMPLPIFLSVLEKDTPETFIHPAIFKMRAYDRENGTSYDETMRLFSFNMHNKDRTAAALCIHRNTLLYRLGRISELFDLPFEHDQVALNLLCSYLILELERYGTFQEMTRLSSTEYKVAAEATAGN